MENKFNRNECITFPLLAQMITFAFLSIKIYEFSFCYAKWTVLITFKAPVLQQILFGTLLPPHLSVAPCQLWSSLPFLTALFPGIRKISVLSYLPEFLSSNSSKAYGGLFRHLALYRWMYLEISGCSVWQGEGEEWVLILKLSLTFLQNKAAWKLKEVEVSRKINMNLFFHWRLPLIYKPSEKCILYCC